MEWDVQSLEPSGLQLKDGAGAEDGGAALPSEPSTTFVVIAGGDVEPAVVADGEPGHLV